LLEVYSKEDLWPGERLNADLSYQLRCTGYHWLRDEVAPGESLQVALRWQGTASMPKDYWVTLRLLDGDGHMWGMGSKRLVDVDKETYWDKEGLERALLIPTSRWPEGEATIEVFELPVDLATPPGEYSVVFRVHPKDVWTGLSLIGPEGSAVGYDCEMAKATVKPAETAPDVGKLPIEKRISADLAPRVRLIGHNALPGQIHPGDRLTLSLFWEAVGEPARDYALKISLLREGRVWAEIVTSPANAAYPTSRWQEGDIWRGQHDLLVDAETPPGEYRPPCSPMALRLGACRWDLLQSWAASGFSRCLHFL